MAFEPSLVGVKSRVEEMSGMLGEFPMVYCDEEKGAMMGGWELREREASASVSRIGGGRRKASVRLSLRSEIGQLDRSINCGAPAASGSTDAKEYRLRERLRTKSCFERRRES